MSVQSTKGKSARRSSKKTLSNQLIDVKDDDLRKFLEPYEKKRLAPGNSPDKVRPNSTKRRLSPVTDLTPPAPFLSFQDLRTLTNFQDFEAAINGTENAALLKLAWDFAERMRELVEDALRHKLWGENPPEGQIRFNSIEKNGKVYINAHIGDSTRSIPRKDIAALESLSHISSQDQTFADREITRRKRDSGRQP